MSYQEIVRAWKDEDYRNSLSESQLAQLPENPAGQVEFKLEDIEIGNPLLTSPICTDCGPRCA